MNADAFVIGGGVAGLAAAVRLSQHGRRVALFEARGVCGGRATSFDDRMGGEALDNGQHAFMGCYHETFALLDVIGSRHRVDVQPSLSLSVVDASGVRSTLACPAWPSPLQMVAGVARWSAVPLVERAQLLRIAPALLQARRAVALGRDTLPVRQGETVRQWLVRHGQGPRLTGLLWEPLAVAALNQGIDVAAARPFVRVLGQVFGPGRHDASIALQSRPLREVIAGPAVRWLEAQGSTVTHHALAHVEIRDGRAISITRRDGDAIDVARRPVIVATPWHALAQTMVGETGPMAPLLHAAAQTAATSIVCVNLWFGRRLLDVPMLGIEGRTFQWIIARGDYLSLVLSGAESILRDGNDAIVARALSDLRHALPVARGIDLIRGMAIREPRATFSLATDQPARPPVTTAVPNLWLASDWVDTGLPGTIEGAAVAGRLAATAVTSSGQ